MQETWVWSLGWEDILEKEMAYSSILAWEIPWTEEPAELQSMGSQTRTQLSNYHHQPNETEHVSWSIYIWQLLWNICLDSSETFLFPLRSSWTGTEPPLWAVQLLWISFLFVPQSKVPGSIWLGDLIFSTPLIVLFPVSLWDWKNRCPIACTSSSAVGVCHVRPESWHLRSAFYSEKC